MDKFYFKCEYCGSTEWFERSETPKEIEIRCICRRYTYIMKEELPSDKSKESGFEKNLREGLVKEGLIEDKPKETLAEKFRNEFQRRIDEVLRMIKPSEDGEVFAEIALNHFKENPDEIIGKDEVVIKIDALNDLTEECNKHLNMVSIDRVLEVFDEYMIAKGSPVRNALKNMKEKK